MLGTALAAFALTAAPASAADPEVQLDTIANADEAWNEVLEYLADADSRYMRFATHDYPTLDIAVTDLDANGRLEVIFRTSRMSRQIVSDAEDFKKPDAYIRSLENVAGIPIGLHASMYQVAEDGTRLEPVKIVVQNGNVTADFPNLMRLKEPYKISTEIPGARLYHTLTTVRSNPKEYGAELIPFRILYHTVWLTDNTLCARLDADVEGDYSVDKAGNIMTAPHTAPIDGREMSRDEFGQSDFLRAFRTYPPVRGAVNWIRCENFRDEDFRANVRTLLAESWYGFSYGLR